MRPSGAIARSDSDLEYAILRELGYPSVPVATTVYAVQIVDALRWHPTDLPVSAIVTPDETLLVPNPPPAPKGIDWNRLTEQELRDMPVLGEMRRLRAAGAALST